MRKKILASALVAFGVCGMIAAASESLMADTLFTDTCIRLSMFVGGVALLWLSGEVWPCKTDDKP